MVERAVSPVIGVILLVAIVVLLAGSTFAFVTQFTDEPEQPPQIALEKTSEYADNCGYTTVEAAGSTGGLVFYRQNDRRVTIDDNGDGTTDAGESVRLPPGTEVTLIAERANESYVMGEFTGSKNADCLALTGSEQTGMQTTQGIRYDVIDRGGSGTVGNSLNEVVITYESGSGADMTAVDSEDVTAVGMDRDGDPDIDVSVEDDLGSVSTSNGGRTVQFQFAGNYNVESDDEIIVRFEDASNPTSSGTHDVTVDINGDVTRTGNISVR